RAAKSLLILYGCGPAVKKSVGTLLKKQKIASTLQIPHLWLLHSRNVAKVSLSHGVVANPPK
ncbi:MAG: hypothetical protein ACMV0H_07045, partial [Aquaspirillum sp.]